MPIEKTNDVAVEEQGTPAAGTPAVETPEVQGEVVQDPSELLNALKAENETNKFRMDIMRKRNAPRNSPQLPEFDIPDDSLPTGKEIKEILSKYHENLSQAQLQARTNESLRKASEKYPDYHEIVNTKVPSMLDDTRFINSLGFNNRLEIAQYIDNCDDPAEELYQMGKVYVSTVSPKEQGALGQLQAPSQAQKISQNASRPRTLGSSAAPAKTPQSDADAIWNMSSEEFRKQYDKVVN